MAVCLTILNLFLNFMYFAVQTCLICVKPQTKTASNLKAILTFSKVDAIWNMRKTLYVLG